MLTKTSRNEHPEQRVKGGKVRKLLWSFSWPRNRDYEQQHCPEKKISRRHSDSNFHDLDGKRSRNSFFPKKKFTLSRGWSSERNLFGFVKSKNLSHKHGFVENTSTEECHPDPLPDFMKENGTNSSHDSVNSLSKKKKRRMHGNKWISNSARVRVIRIPLMKMKNKGISFGREKAKDDGEESIIQSTMKPHNNRSDNKQCSSFISDITEQDYQDEETKKNNAEFKGSKKTKNQEENDGNTTSPTNENKSKNKERKVSFSDHNSDCSKFFKITSDVDNTSGSFKLCASDDEELHGSRSRLSGLSMSDGEDASGSFKLSIPDDDEFRVIRGRLSGISMSDGDNASGSYKKCASDEDELHSSRRRRSGLSTGTIEQFLAMAESQDDLLSNDEKFHASLQHLELWTKHERARDWLSSLCRLDPRWQIKTFFEECAQAGVADIEVKGIDIMALSPILLAFARAQVFTVWRPTSIESIRKMMTGEAVGKGLGIKGKSAKRGLLSGYVPFLQIHSNEEDKEKVGTLPKNSRIRVFFKSIQIREKAVIELQKVLDEMVKIVDIALEKVHNAGKLSDEDFNLALEDLRFQMTEPEVRIIDDNSHQAFGVDIPERLFWEAFVMRKDITRKNGSPMDTGRPSEPAFQDMNFATTRKPKKYDPKAVVFQYGGHDDDDPLCPLTLLMAYEDDGAVLPVASDFDGFLMGTKGVKYESSLPPEQIEVVKRTIYQIEEVLDDKSTRERSWTTNWLNVLKKNAVHGVKPNMPQYGYGDPKSYCIMENAIGRLRKNGAVRHGSECFNYFFPQELDEQFLVISGNFPDNVPWRYLNVKELQDYLMDQIDKGFTFPLNPKWILCDQGWAAVYDKLRASQHPNVQNSLNAWMPPDSGVREQIEKIRQKHPDGFVREKRISLNSGDTHAMDLAKLQLKRYLALQRAKRKLRIVLYWIRIAQEASSKRKLENETIAYGEEKIPPKNMMN